GQTWSAFQDATVFPSTLDFQGPAGIITSRRPQVRIREVWNERWTSVISIEDPKSDIANPAAIAGEKSTPYPDLDGNVRWQPGSDYHLGQYAVFNLRYYPAERVMLGVEFLYGVREDKDGSHGDDVRLQFSAQYRF